MKLHLSSAAALIGILLAVSSCNRTKKEVMEPDALAMHIDSTIKAGDDFFLFANNKWFKQNPIPASEQSNGIWQLIQDTINAQIEHVCTSSAAMADVAKGSNKQKIGDY
jgi:putative endopeptidase